MSNGHDPAGEVDVVAPRPTRALAAVFSVVAISDALQQAHGRLRTD